MFKQIVLALLVISCSSKSPEKTVVKETPAVQKEFSRGEIILATQVLTKIFDGEMAPLACVADHDEASLLLRTIRPRMEVVIDDIEALLDDPKEVSVLVNTCEKNCTCDYLDDLFKEHQVPLNKQQRKVFKSKTSEKESARCLNYGQETFCQSELYKALESEKADFSFEE